MRTTIFLAVLFCVGTVYGFDYPVDCTTPAERMEYLQIAEEKLRLLHNEVGKWARGEMTLAGYSALPATIKATLPAWKDQLTQEEWLEFFDEEFEPRMEKVHDLISTQEALLKKSSKWDIKPEDIPKYEDVR